MPRSILIVEDDKNIADLIRLYLEKEGMTCHVAGDGLEGLEKFHAVQPDLVMLDIMLPSMDGWSVCRKIRETSKVPIIMLTAKGELEDKVSGLEMGADDYITKPFETKEVLARVHAVLRRFGEEEQPEKRLSFDKLVVNLDSYELLVDGRLEQGREIQNECCRIIYKMCSAAGNMYAVIKEIIRLQGGPDAGSVRAPRKFRIEDGLYQPCPITGGD